MLVAGVLLLYQTFKDNPMIVNYKKYGITLHAKLNIWALPLYVDWIGRDFLYVQFLCFGFTWMRP